MCTFRFLGVRKSHPTTPIKRGNALFTQHYFCYLLSWCLRTFFAKYYSHTQKHLKRKKTPSFRSSQPPMEKYVFGRHWSNQNGASPRCGDSPYSCVCRIC